MIDLDRDDLLRIPAIGPEEADEILALIDELTVEDDDESAASNGGVAAQDGAESI